MITLFLGVLNTKEVVLWDKWHMEMDNGLQPILMVLITPVLFLPWDLRTSATKKAYFYNNDMVENTAELRYLRFLTQLPKSLAVMMYDVK